MRRDVRAKGYSKAIDIWSIGCITATLLTNDVLFGDDHAIPPAEQSRMSALSKLGPWDLSMMDDSGPWEGIGRKAKSFVRGCLMLNEELRLTAKQALLHQWFTHRLYAADFQAEYQRAIADWRPRKQSGRLIEYIDTTNVVPAKSRTEEVEHLAKKQKTASHHFPTDRLQATTVTSIKNFIQHPTPWQSRALVPQSAHDTYFTNTPPAARARANQLFASPPCIPESPTQSYPAMRPSTSDFSIMDYAPPADTQLPPRAQHAVNVVATQTDFNESMSQSQSMLDDCSPPKGTSMAEEEALSISLEQPSASYATNYLNADSLMDIDPSEYLR